MYALVISNTIQATSGALPSGAKRLDNGKWITPYEGKWTKAEHEATGWFTVAEVAKPPDTATHTHDRSVTLVGGVPTETWTQRPKTQAEIDATNAAGNQSSIVTNLNQDLAALQTILDTANATINSNPAAHIKTMARNSKRLTRTALNDYTSAD